MFVYDAHTCAVCGSKNGKGHTCNECTDWAAETMETFFEERGWDQLPLLPYEDYWREELGDACYTNNH